MKPVHKMNLAELAAFVQEHLRAHGIDTVVSGGACVAIYTRGKYVSMGLDLIHRDLLSPKRRSIREAMSGLGFTEHGRYFHHPDTEIVVEFPKGPPAVGEEPVKEIHHRKESTGTLRILSPTDCIKDRLTWFYYDNDLQCLEQAILVARAMPVNLDEVEEWSRREGEKELFSRIRGRLQGKE